MSRLWDVRIILGQTVTGPEVVRNATVNGYRAGIAVKRVLDACCPRLRVGDRITIVVERKD